MNLTSERKTGSYKSLNLHLMGRVFLLFSFLGTGFPTNLYASVLNRGTGNLPDPGCSLENSLPPPSLPSTLPSFHFLPKENQEAGKGLLLTLGRWLGSRMI